MTHNTCLFSAFMKHQIITGLQRNVYAGSMELASKARVHRARTSSLQCQWSTSPCQRRARRDNTGLC